MAFFLPLSNYHVMKKGSPIDVPLEFPSVLLRSF